MRARTLSAASAVVAVNAGRGTGGESDGQETVDGEGRDQASGLIDDDPQDALAPGADGRPERLLDDHPELTRRARCLSEDAYATAFEYVIRAMACRCASQTLRVVECPPNV